MRTTNFAQPLAWIDAQRDDMLSTLRRWAEINSGTYNHDGLAAMETELSAAFAPLGGEERRLEIEPAESIDASGNVARAPLGRALRFSKRPDAPIRVLLAIHYDTVFPSESPFRRTDLTDADTLRGPGVVDAKGGIVVMLTALAALERSDVANRVGWEVLLNPDEEIGSPGSAPLLADAARRNHLGLVFEPALPDGSLVGARKGSGSFTAVVRGRSAHAGRDFDKGRNAIVALAELIVKLASPTGPGVIVNCGKVSGGGATNIVPDLAIGRFNVRADSSDDQKVAEQVFVSAAAEIGRRDGITMTLHGGFTSPPKPLDARSARLMDAILSTGRELGLSLSHQPSGGTCDGNKLAAAGLPVVDSLGPVGGELHSDREYVRISSLAERAKVTGLLLMRLAAGQVSVP
ncbi:MAG: hydrolase [Tepidisphaeraceae bacterium]